MTTDTLPKKLKSVLEDISTLMRGSMSPSEYKFAVLGLVFLKAMSDEFYRLVKEHNIPPKALDYSDTFTLMDWRFIPPYSRYDYIHLRRNQNDIGQILDIAMRGIIDHTPRLSGVLYQRYDESCPDTRKLAKVIDYIGTLDIYTDGSEIDIIGRVYEHFLNETEMGEFYTPKPIVDLLVEVLQPDTHVYDPTCGTGGLLLQIRPDVRKEISLLGQEANPESWRLANMNMMMADARFNLGSYPADTLHNDVWLGSKFDYIMANPPYNMKDWGAELLRDDPRWEYGLPPSGNANFAWIQHIVHHLAENGKAGIVMANSTLSGSTGNEGDIRLGLVKADLVECVISLPDKLFYKTGIPVCVWVINRNKPSHRRGQVLMIDAKDMGAMISRTQRTLSGDEIERIAGVYHAWGKHEGGYQDVNGFCRSADFANIKASDGTLTPGRYVNVKAQKADDEDESFEAKMTRFVRNFEAQEKESNRLSRIIAHNNRVMGFGTPPLTSVLEGKYSVSYTEAGYCLVMGDTRIEIPVEEWGEFVELIRQNG